MVTEDAPDGVPAEAKQFQAPPDHETGDQKIRRFPSAVNREPTEDELSFYRKMSHEEWVATVDQGKAEIDRIVAQRKVDRKHAEEKRNEKWLRRTRALESIQISGNPVEDAQAFFLAAEIELGALGSPYATAYREGNNVGILQYFRDVQSNQSRLPASMGDAPRAYWNKFFEVSRSIIDAAEAVRGNESI